MDSNKKVVKVKLVKHEWPDERAARHKKYFKVAGALLLSVLLFAGGVFVGSGLNGSVSDTKGLANSKFQAIYRIMNEKWYFGSEIDNLANKLMDAAIYGMTNQSLDPHTEYMDAELAESFLSSMEGQFVGIGVQYSTATQDYIVTRVFKDSPAEQAGMKVGDILRKVDNKSVNEIENLSSAVKGEKDTHVLIQVQRGSEFLDLDCIRNEVNASANGYIKDGIGVLEILTIGENTADVVRDILAYFNENHVTKLLIDLRDNGGGYLSTIVDIASYFLPQGSVVLQEKTSDQMVSEDKTNSKISPYHYDKITVLINENTASAAEVLTLALKETLDNVTVVGDVSYGKGTIQTSQPFSDGSMIKYTKAIWLSPNGTWINEKGITPDVLIETEKALKTGAPKDFEAVGVDSVSQATASMQIYLKYLGYPIERTDGYFSVSTLNALKQFEKDYGLHEQDTLDSTLLSVILSKVIYVSHTDEAKDVQMQKAFELTK